MRKDWLGWAAMLAALAVTAAAEWSLAVAAGFPPVVAGGLPVAIDAYALRAMEARREIFPPVALMIVTNITAHLVAGGALAVSPWLVAAVSAVAPLVLWRVHALRHPAVVAQKATVEEAQAFRTEHLAEHEPEGYSPVSTPAVPDVEVQRVPAPAAYPELPRPVPEVVPAGVQTLPIVARPEPERHEIRHESPMPVPGAEQPRTRVEVRVPEVEYRPVPSGYADPPAEDELTALARRDYVADLASGQVPTIRELRAAYNVGQARAQRIRDELRRGR